MKFKPKYKFGVLEVKIIDKKTQKKSLMSDQYSATNESSFFLCPLICSCHVLCETQRPWLACSTCSQGPASHLQGAEIRQEYAEWQQQRFGWNFFFIMLSRSRRLLTGTDILKWIHYLCHTRWCLASGRTSSSDLFYISMKWRENSPD